MVSRSSRRLEWVGCHLRASRVWALDAGWSMAKIGPNGPKFLLRNLLDRQPSRRPMTVANVPAPRRPRRDGVPGRPGRCGLKGQPEQDGCVERVHGRPALGAVAR